MAWRAKCALFKLLSRVPFGSAIYRLLQQKLTKSTVPTEGRLRQKLAIGWRYLEALARLRFELVGLLLGRVGALLDLVDDVLVAAALSHAATPARAR